MLLHLKINMGDNLSLKSKFKVTWQNMAIFQKIKRSAMKNCLRTTTAVLLILIAFQTWNQTLDRILKERSSGSFIRFYTQMQWEGKRRCILSLDINKLYHA